MGDSLPAHGTVRLKPGHQPSNPHREIRGQFESLERKYPVVKRRRRKRREATIEATYVCDVCGEEIVIPIDRSAGESQEFIEDCPVCCRPQVIRVEVEDNGDVRAWSDGEAN